MFERFRRSRDDSTAGAVATRDRDRELDDANPRVGRERVEDRSAGERDRSVVAGEGEADLDANRRFEREDMSRGADGDTALDRDRARDDLARDDVTDRDDRV